MRFQHYFTNIGFLCDSHGNEFDYLQTSQVVEPAAGNNHNGKPMFKSFIQRKNSNLHVRQGKKNPSQDRRDLTR